MTLFLSSRRPRQNRRPRRLGHFETMESRRLMAGDITYNWADNEVHVTGSEQDDHIIVEDRQELSGWGYSGGRFYPRYENVVAVSVRDPQGNLRKDAQGNDLEQTFEAAIVRRVEVDARGGEDTVDNLTNIRSTLIGGDDRDILNGGTNDDVLVGQAGNDSLHGGDGNDVLDGGAGDDTLYGERHDDTYVYRGGSYYSLPANQEFTVDEGSDTIYEFSGTSTDTLDFAAALDGVTVDLADTGSGRVQQVHSGLRLRLMNSDGIENVIGTEYADTIRGNGRDNRLEAGWGDDTLEGRGGDDHLDGSRGRDIYVFGDDSRGDDEVFDYYLDGARNRLDFRDHRWGITLDIDSESWQQVSNDLDLRLDHADTIKEVVGSDLADTIFGNYENNTIWARAGNDTVHGREGNDTLYGNDGHDTLHGNSGHDSLYGHDGDDTLNGGSGDDYLSGGNNDDTLTGGTGRDTLRGWAGNDQLFGDLDDSTVDGGSGWDYHRKASWWFWWG